MTWNCFIAVIYSAFHTGITLAWAGHAVNNTQRASKKIIIQSDKTGSWGADSKLPSDRFSTVTVRDLVQKKSSRLPWGVLWVLMWVQHLGKFMGFDVQTPSPAWAALCHQLLAEGLAPVLGHAELPTPCTAGGHIRHGQGRCWTGLTSGVTLNTHGMFHLYDCVYPSCFASSSWLGFHAFLAYRRLVTHRSTLWKSESSPRSGLQADSMSEKPCPDLTSIIFHLVEGLDTTHPWKATAPQKHC